MRGQINGGQLVTIAPGTAADVTVGNAVLVKWRRGYLLHLVKAVRGDQLQIGNNVDRINRWVSANAIKERLVAIGK